MDYADRLRIALMKLDAVRKGESKVFSDLELDAIDAHYAPLDTEEANSYFKRFCSKPNPDRVGTLDTYIGMMP